MKKLLFFAFMITIGTLKASDLSYLDEAVLKVAQKKVTILDHFANNFEGLEKLEERFGGFKVNEDSLTEHYYIPNYSYPEYHLKPKASLIIGGWTKEQKKEYVRNEETIKLMFNEIDPRK
ncbi:MAG: hypothetical protein ACXWL2_00850 [Candidatus Chromulinivorax sp.]